MKPALLLSVLGITFLSSCSTAFKSGQTPDDVYYSPGREIAAAKEDEVRKQDQAAYQEYISSQDDRYLRMKVANHSRWSSLDDYDYWYDSRYDFSNYNNYSSYRPYSFCYERNAGYIGSPYSSYGGYGWSMPYHTIIAYSSPKYAGGSTSGSNISAYRNKSYNNSNYGYKDPKSGAFISTSNTSNFGSLLKRVFSSGSSSSANNNSGSSFDRPARTFSTTPTPTNSSNTTPSTSSSAGGHSGGYSSTGSSTSTGRGGRG
ncbi:MAG: hypothetical protein JO301_06285 [Chitinophagaceae bacterium]|nr:hypothetical protein [Chitinophagaceae bacterium]